MASDAVVVRRLVPETLTAAAWAPFGWLPVADTDPEDGRHRLEFAWDDAHVNVIGHSVAELSAAVGALRCEALFRHDTHTQVLMALDHDAVIVVAPRDLSFAHEDDLAEVRAFTVAPLQPLVLHRGTWHWGPYPLAAPEVRLFNVQGLRYRDDNRCADLRAQGLALEVEVGGPHEGRSL